ncbi:MAG: molybdopterin-dependent oxidoreductase [bacterium]|nr:molybdopterin-dependent oxidoreductase [bacterium]
MAVIRTLCGQCGMGCGVRARTGEGRDVMIEGDRMHPANGGRLCDRAGHFATSAVLDGRLLHPLIDGRPASWDRAVAQVARRLSVIIDRHGPGSIALHMDGGLLTEDYYVANKLMKGFLGSAHIHAPWSAAGGVAAAQRAAFGEDVMPAAYEDIDRADLILLVGADAALAHPVLLDRIQAARQVRGTHLMVLEVHDAAADADSRLAIPAGCESLFFNGLLLHCHDAGLIDTAFLDRHVTVPSGFWRDLRPGHDLWSVARACDLAPAAIRAVYDRIAATRHAVTLFSPADDGRDGQVMATAILNFHLATGRIGRPGATPFAITCAPNGMGGRDVGCMASALAAHRDFTPDAIEWTARFWGGPSIAMAPGLSGDALLQAIGDGHIQALWSIGGSPSTSPWLGEAFRTAPHTILSTDRLDPDAGAASIVLPSAAWVEKDGTVTGTDRLISRQRRLFPLPGQARPDWWIVTRVAQAMGWHAAFHYERPADIYREHARLTAYRNGGARLLDLRRHAPISNPAYDELTPWRWGEVPFDEGRFPTPDSRARLMRSWD